jgi:hypothetical protein
MKLIGGRWRPDLAPVPIGGNFTMDPADAAWAVKEPTKRRSGRSQDVPATGIRSTRMQPCGDVPTGTACRRAIQERGCDLGPRLLRCPADGRVRGAEA